MPTLGLDVGASKIYYVVLSAKGGPASGRDGEQRLLEAELKIQEQTKEAFFELCRSINEQIKTKGLVIEKAGVGLPGTLKDGIAAKVTNLPALEGLDASSELQKIFAVPVRTVNDAKAFIYAEVTLGAAKGMRNVVGLTLGSGLGGGIVINGDIYLGRGNAGEVSYLAWFDNDQKAEDFVSAKFFKKFGEDPLALRNKAEAGDANAKSAYEEFGRNLGVIIANLVNLLDPDAIVLGGGLSAAYDLFIGQAKETAAKLIVNPESKAIAILKNALGPAAGAIGAALLAQ